jgi:hypothetical protein
VYMTAARMVLEEVTKVDVQLDKCAVDVLL